MRNGAEVLSGVMGNSAHPHDDTKHKSILHSSITQMMMRPAAAQNRHNRSDLVACSCPSLLVITGSNSRLKASVKSEKGQAWEGVTIQQKVRTHGEGAVEGGELAQLDALVLHLLLVLRPQQHLDHRGGAVDILLTVARDHHVQVLVLCAAVTQSL